MSQHVPVLVKGITGSERAIVQPSPERSIQSTMVVSVVKSRIPGTRASNWSVSGLYSPSADGHILGMVSSIHVSVATGTENTTFA